MDKAEYILGDQKTYEFTLLKDNAIIDVTGATPTLLVVDNIISLNTILAVSGTVDAGTDGKVYFPILTTDFKAAGRYSYRIKLVFSTGDTETTPWGVWEANK